MARCRCTLFVLAATFLALTALAQTPSPEVGDAVLLATNSIQVDRDAVVVSGDCVVNFASTTLILGEKDLSLDQNVSTPAGYALKANSVDLDGGVVVHGSVYTNTLQNNGTILGSLITPVSLPFISTLPQLLSGAAGSQAVSVGNSQTSTLAAGSYANVSVGRDATLHLSGGSYFVGTLTTDRGASIIFDAAADVVVNGNMTLGANATIDNAPGLTTKFKRFFVHGDVSIAKDDTVKAIKATVEASGAILAGSGLQLTGSLVGRDIKVGQSSSLTLRSGFRNLAPVANAQDVSTNGSAPITITLTGFDGDGDPLIFSIVTQPTNGTLSGLTSTGPTSATVVYTPNSPDPEDAFVFRVTDSEGASGQATVSINGGRPAPSASVSVDDGSSDVLQNEPTTLMLNGSASNGATLTFSIVGSGPSHGTLGTITQPSAPGAPASVVYTPAQGYTGPDSFQYQGCAGATCDGGTYTLNVAARSGGEPADIAPDITVSTATESDLSIELPGSTSSQSVGRFVLRPTAAVLIGAEVAGNVADANNDGFGDNHNALPGSAPVLMSAGVGQTGGAGSNGTVRMEFEWDITNFAGTADSLQSASVLLHTNRGTTDSADTFFYAVGVNNDGQLTDGDFERPAEQINAVMPVPQSQGIGQDGTFSFDVLQQVKAAMKAGFTRFSIQGRVNETAQQVSTRGLQVYTTASGNLGSLEPGLGLATPGVTPPPTYRVLSLPSAGTLFDSNNTQITSVPYTLPSGVLRYSSPNTIALTSFNYEVTLGQTVDTGIVHIRVYLGTCATDSRLCNTGRTN